MKKVFMLASLLVLTSLAQAQSGLWRNFTQINPDTVNPENVKMISSGNNLWCVWEEGYVYLDTMSMLYISKYDGSIWTIKKMENTGWYNYFSGFNVIQDQHSNAHVYYYNSTMMLKNGGNQKISSGVYSATCDAYDSSWAGLGLCYESINIENIDATITGNGVVYILSQDHMHVSSQQGSGILSHRYDTTWSSYLEAQFDDATIVNHSSPSIAIDKNDSIWKGWCTSVEYYLPYWQYKVTVNGVLLDTSNISEIGNLELVVDSLNSLWAFYTKNDSIWCRRYTGGVWQPRSFMGIGLGLKAAVDGKGYIWLACNQDSIIYANTFDQTSWLGWDSVTVGSLQHISLDQMGNPCIAWWHDDNIYSAIYCRDTLLPTVSITSPVAGAEYTEGQQVPVQWNASSDGAFLSIYCQRTGSSEWQKLYDMVSVDSVIQWIVPNDSVDYRFKAEAIDYGWNEAADSTGWFAVKPLGVQDNPNEQTKISFGLRNSGPNPFKQFAVINYQLSQKGSAQVKVYNASGQIVKTIVNMDQNAGMYTAKWNGKNEQNIPASAGVYICRLSSGGQTVSVKLIKLK